MTAAAALTAEPALAVERAKDAPLVEGLIVRAFGPGRYAKAAERLREGNAAIPSLSFLAWSEGEAVGCVRLWRVRVGETPALLLGPIAVEEAFRKQGLGASLVHHACEAARRAGERLVVLVGDEPFFGPLGFSAALARDVRMPGPADQRRVLARALVQGAADGLAGLVRV
jgi:predicted N-acetyltransferase YhbS